MTPLPLDKMAAILADNIFKYIFVNEKFCILIKISLMFVPKGPIDDNPALVQIIARRRIGDKPLSEPMLTHRHTYAALRGDEFNNSYGLIQEDIYHIVTCLVLINWN